MTYVELLAVLVILSVLALAALPYAEVTVQRTRELELRRALRTVRTAIDRLHADWEAERISTLSRAVSADGYPKTLAVLVEGVERGDAEGTRTRYLRRIPADPFADARIPAAQQWALRSYRDEPDAPEWGGEDVYDVRTRSRRTAIDGTRYDTW